MATLQSMAWKEGRGMTDLEAYRAFIARKLATAPVEGIPNHGPISPLLFPHQRTMVDVALRKGRFALFHDTGLGKGWQILEWARLVGEHTGKPVLVLAPLAVARQFEREAAKSGRPCASSRPPPTSGLASTSPTTTSCTNSTYRSSRAWRWTSPRS